MSNFALETAAASLKERHLRTLLADRERCEKLIISGPEKLSGLSVCVCLCVSVCLCVCVCVRDVSALVVSSSLEVEFLSA